MNFPDFILSSYKRSQGNKEFFFLTLAIQTQTEQANMWVCFFSLLPLLPGNNNHIAEGIM